MKQHIEPDYLENLSEKHKAFLYEWWRNRFRAGDRAVCDLWTDEAVCIYEKENSFEVKEPIVCPVDEGELRSDRNNLVPHGPKVLPLFSIGQMLEFIHDYSSYAIYMDCIILPNSMINGRKGEHKIEFYDLVDGLWGAVKWILEHKVK